MSTRDQRAASRANKRARKQQPPPKVLARLKTATEKLRSCIIALEREEALEVAQARVDFYRREYRDHWRVVDKSSLQRAKANLARLQAEPADTFPEV